MKRAFAIASSATVLLLSLTACSAAPSPKPSETAIEIGNDTTIIDVRTPEEYAAGHLEGARLLDFNGGELAAALPTMDLDGKYLVYCRSGNRSAQAISAMEQAGFESLTNLGSLEQAARATGLPIVR